MTLTDQDRIYAENTSRFAFDHSRYYAEAICDEDRKLANHHRREIVQWAKYLEAGLTKCAQRDGEI